MSLVGDALRRARAEAAERRGVAIPPGLGPPIRRSLLGGPVLVGAALVLVAAAAAVVTWWVVEDNAPATRASSRTSTAEPRIGGEDRSAGAAEQPTTVSVATPASPPMPAEDEPAADATGPAALPADDQSTSTSSMSEREAGHQTAAPDDAIAASAPPPTPPPITNPAGERSFVIDAELGYAKLHLDYLVYKPSAPFARINSRDVIVGSIIEGFKVHEIGPDFVRLSDSRGPLTLRVR